MAEETNKGNSSNPDEAPQTRYSDDELGEFRDLITKKMRKAKEELDYLQEAIKASNSQNGQENSSTNLMEDSSTTFQREQMSQLAERQRKFIKNLEDALVRIENKTYGICSMTGKLISKDRLRAVPHTTLSYEAKMKQNK